MRRALAIGINRYPFWSQEEAKKHLSTPATDAEKIACLLDATLGDRAWEVKRMPESFTPEGKFQVEKKEITVSQAELKNAIEELLYREPLPEVALLFFAGHGIRRDWQGKNEGFLAASDTRSHTQEENQAGISFSWLRSQLLNSPVKQQIVWLDCCQSGDLLSFTAAELEQLSLGGDRCLIAACQSGVAYALSAGGVLTQELVKALNPALHPEEKWINTGTVTDLIEERREKEPLLKRQIPICKNFGERIRLWKGKGKNPARKLSKVTQLKIKTFKDYLEKLEQDYTAVAEKRSRESNPQERNNLDRQEQKIAEEIAKIERKINALKAEDIAEEEINARRKAAQEAEDKINSLRELLTNSERDILNYAKIAYQVIAPDYWPYPVPTTIPEILADVREMSQAGARYSPLERFVAWLVAATVANSQSSRSTSRSLWKWANDNINDFSKLLNEVRKQGFCEDLGNQVQLEMVAIPEGKFMMGSPEDEERHRESESPNHQVTVKSFFMGKYAVTQAQWKAVAALPQINLELNPDPSRFKGSDRPVECVSWLDAVEFCDRLGRHTGKPYRLPSEAEWEYACRAGTTTPFHFGKTITTDLANYDGNYTYGAGSKGIYRQETTPVGSFVANAFGLYDMHGNVWEWCVDPWHSNYEGAPTDGSVWDENNNDNRYYNYVDLLVNIKNDNRYRLLRGGSWFNIPVNCRAAIRLYGAPGGRSSNFGFRVVCAVAWTP